MHKHIHTHARTQIFTVQTPLFYATKIIIVSTLDCKAFVLGLHIKEIQWDPKFKWTQHFTMCFIWLIQKLFSVKGRHFLWNCTCLPSLFFCSLLTCPICCSWGTGGPWEELEWWIKGLQGEEGSRDHCIPLTSGELLLDPTSWLFTSMKLSIFLTAVLIVFP